MKHKITAVCLETFAQKNLKRLSFLKELSVLVITKYRFLKHDLVRS